MEIIIFLVMNTLRIYPQQLSHRIYKGINYSYHVVHYISTTYLSYNWKFVSFDCLHPISLPPLPLASDND